MTKYILIFIMFSSLLSCQDRDKPIDIESINGYDFRLFQSTNAWELAKAIEDQDLGLISDIVKSDTVDINTIEPKYGQTLLMLSILTDKYDSFIKLIELGADIHIHNHYDSSSAIHNACNYRPMLGNNLKYLTILIEKGANVNDVSNAKQKNTPLMIASGKFHGLYSYLNMVKLLVEEGAQINYVNYHKNYALRESLIYDNYDISLYLLKQGANYELPVLFKEGNIRKENGYIMETLSHKFLELGTKEYEGKMAVIQFLESKGLEYKRMKNVTGWYKKKIQDMYPDSWEEYLKVY
ncbi:MAG: ankyrin repeat domain-containing protein [Candidatus Kapaibacterium sp.]